MAQGQLKNHEGALYFMDWASHRNCGLLIAECGLKKKNSKSEIRNSKSEIQRADAF
jgi:hypothetical protein